MKKTESGIAVSVIIPAYNLESYIGACMESIVSQSLKKIELIVVDDGSTDNTIQIIQNYIDTCIEEIEDIILLRNDQNRGAGYSRNRGLDIARGKYLLFLDGDDFFEHDMIERMFCKCEECGADIAICNWYYFDNNTGESVKCDDSKYFPVYDWDNCFQLSDISAFAFQYIHEIAWNKMFRHDFIKENQFRFQCQQNANDQFFVFAGLLKARKIVRLEECLLSYRMNVKNQLSSSVSKDPYCIWNATKEISDYMDRIGQYELYKKSFHTYVVNRLIFSLRKIDEKENLLQFYRNEGFDRLRIKVCEPGDFSIPYFYQVWKWLTELKCAEDIATPYLREIFWNSEKCKELFSGLQQRQIVLWGAGADGNMFLEKSSDYNLDIRCVIDRDENKVGTVISDYRISDSSSIKNGDFIVATNPLHIPAIQYTAKCQGKAAEILDVRAYLYCGVDMEQSIVSC